MTEPAPSAGAERTLQAERSFAWVVLVAAVVFGMYWRTSGSLVAQWQQSQTHGHGFVVLPVFVWLVWMQRHALARLTVRPYWPAAVVLCALGVLWLAGEATATAALGQLALVAMVPASVALLLGTAWLRVLAFPLFFLWLAVPVGDSLVPTLMDWTADFTVAALKASGIPVYRDGTHFSTPSGDWSIVESCSGVRYLFACLTVAALYAWVMYRSATRRVVFVIAAVCIAIVTNWLRAYAIVLLAHLTDNRVAAGVDHLLYGGVFLGIVLALTMLVGLLWREESPRMPDRARAAASEAVSASSWRPGVPAALLLLVLCIWPLGIEILAQPARPRLERVADIVGTAGWTAVGTPGSAWQPQMRNPLQLATQTFEKQGRRVTLHIGLFARPTPDSKLVSASNRLLPVDDPRWSVVQRGQTDIQLGSETVTIATELLASPTVRLTVWHWYAVDGARTHSTLGATARQLLARLARRSELSAWVVLSATADGPQDAQATLSRFAVEMLGAIDAALRTASEAPRPGN